MSNRFHPRSPCKAPSVRLWIELLETRTLADANAWSSFAHDAQHTGFAPLASQSLQTIAWQTPVDLNPPMFGNGLSIHYGSPLITDANTVVEPVKTSDPAGRFQLEGRNGSDGSLKWVQPTDYILPPANWTPSYGPTLTAANWLYFPGAGGTVYYTDQPDANGPLCRRTRAGRIEGRCPDRSDAGGRKGLSEGKGVRARLGTVECRPRCSGGGQVMIRVLDHTSLLSLIDSANRRISVRISTAGKCTLWPWPGNTQSKRKSASRSIDLACCGHEYQQ